MTKFNVVIKNWKTGEVVSTYSNVDADEVARIEADNHAHAPASWDVEVTKI
jgi:hypothetical protein